MSIITNEDLLRRIAYAEERERELEILLKKQIAKKEYADKHESARIWYAAAVDVRRTEKDIKNNKAQLAEYRYWYNRRMEQEERKKNGKNRGSNARDGHDPHHASHSGVADEKKQ